MTTEETASMRDFYVNPKHWVFCLLTLGAYAAVVWLHRYSCGMVAARVLRKRPADKKKAPGLEPGTYGLTVR